MPEYLDTEWCLAIEAWIMSPMTNKNSTADNMQPCLTPLPTTKAAERVPGNSNSDIWRLALLKLEFYCAIRKLLKICQRLNICLKVWNMIFRSNDHHDWVGNNPFDAPNFSVHFQLFHALSRKPKHEFWPEVCNCLWIVGVTFIYQRSPKLKVQCREMSASNSN